MKLYEIKNKVKDLDKLISVHNDRLESLKKERDVHAEYINSLFEIELYNHNNIDKNVDIAIHLKEGNIENVIEEVPYKIVQKIEEYNSKRDKWGKLKDV